MPQDFSSVGESSCQVSTNRFAVEVIRNRRDKHSHGRNDLQWTILLKEAASLLWDFYRDPLRSLTLLSLNVSSQKS